MTDDEQRRMTEDMAWFGLLAFYLGAGAGLIVGALLMFAWWLWQ